jgi:hypothetical protein
MRTYSRRSSFSNKPAPIPDHTRPIDPVLKLSTSLHRLYLSYRLWSAIDHLRVSAGYP